MGRKRKSKDPLIAEYAKAYKLPQAAILYMQQVRVLPKKLAPLAAKNADQKFLDLYSRIWQSWRIITGGLVALPASKRVTLCGRGKEDGGGESDYWESDDWETYIRGRYDTFFAGKINATTNTFTKGLREELIEVYDMEITDKVKTEMYSIRRNSSMQALRAKQKAEKE